MDTSKENGVADMEVPELIKEPEVVNEAPKKRKYDTTAARNQKKINREIERREQEFQNQNLTFIFHRLSDINTKLNTIITGKRKLDFVDVEVPKKKQMIEKIPEPIPEKKEIQKVGWDIKSGLLNLAVGGITTIAIKFAAGYVRNRLLKTNDGDVIIFPSNTF